MPFALLCFFTYAYPVSILLKNGKEVLAVRTSHRKEVLALLSCSQFPKSIVIPTSVQASGTPASASISPEFLASVIQAIQSLISAIVQQSLSAVVRAHSVSQGLPAIAAQGSSLATCAAHLDACGFHQPWSPSGPTGVLPSTSSSSTPPVPVATPTNVLTGMTCRPLLFCGLSFLFFPWLPCLL